uniref:Uncharacterized protein n=1 Tax=Mycena chlorophos TaxID=658473 RepID=A0ABQ0L4S8_MYCCL|nr:predicted protein [Mycena chlorophos]
MSWPHALDWPLQDYRINTPASLFPRSAVRDDDDGFNNLLTPSGKWFQESAKTPSSANTFGFPVSPISPRSPRPNPRRKSAALSLYASPRTPLDKQKLRLRRYAAAEARLARLSGTDVDPPTAMELNVAALKFAVRALAVHLFDSQQALKAMQSGTRDRGARDSTRWMAEHHVQLLEALHVDLRKQLNKGTGKASGKENEDQSENNLVRFLGSSTVVPVFTRTFRRERPPVSKAAAASAADRKRMMVGSPMQLSVSAPPQLQTPRNEWSWDTRIRAVLLYPSPKPPQLPPASTETSDIVEFVPAHSRSTTETMLTTTTPTSETFSSFDEPDTPLTELNDIFEEDEDEDDDEGDDDESLFEDYPTFTNDSALGSWKPAKPPPLATNFKPDLSYAWLADPSMWASPSGWKGDGWEVASPSHARSPSYTMEPSSASTISPASSYPYGFPSAGYIQQQPAQGQAASSSRTSRRQTTQPVPAASQNRSSFWSSIPGRHRSLKPVSATERESYARKPLPLPPIQVPQTAPPIGPSTPGRRKDKEKGLSFLSGLVRKGTVRGDERDRDSSAAEPSPTMSDASSAFSFGMGHNKLRKQQSLRRMGSNLSVANSVTVRA